MAGVVTPDWKYQPWNSAAARERMRGQPIPRRSPDWRTTAGTDFSLSPDGSLLALARADQEISSIDVIDLQSKRVLTLAAPDPLLMLATPTFTPSGELCVRVTPPTYSGFSEMWFTSGTGGPARVYGAAGDRRLFGKPSFSASGGKAICVRNFDDDPLAGLPNPAAVLPEYRSAHFFSLFEIDFLSGMETQLVRNAFSPFALMYYGPEIYQVYGNTLPPEIKRS